VRRFILVLSFVLFFSCEESRYYIHIVNNTLDSDLGEIGQRVRYALAKDSGAIHTISPGQNAIHEVPFGVPYGIEFYGPEEGEPRKIGVRYTGDDSYEFYTLKGIPLSVINTLSFDVELSCGGYLNVEEPLVLPGQRNSVPGEVSATIKIYTQTPNFNAVLKDFEDKDGQKHLVSVVFTVKYNEDNEAERIIAEIR
jgi:hypothetical protein